MAPLGLIAGEGVFPLLVARGAKAAGRRVVCVGLAGNASNELRSECDEIPLGRHRPAWQLGPPTSRRRLHRSDHGGAGSKSRHVHTFCGGEVYFPIGEPSASGGFDYEMNKRPNAVLHAIIDELSFSGIQLIDSTAYCADQLATEGVMTRRQPRKIN